MDVEFPDYVKWNSETTNKTMVRFTCGYCGTFTISEKGLTTYVSIDDYNKDPLADEFEYELFSESNIGVYFCSYCHRPTYLEFFEQELELQVPAPLKGRAIENLPKNVNGLYTEARKCIQAGAFTAAVMCFRTLLMYVAVDKGAPEEKRFIDYVNYLNDENYIPREGREWVDELRKKGNVANHQIVMMDKQDAEALLDFVEMLLLVIYDFPNRLK